MPAIPLLLLPLLSGLPAAVPAPLPHEDAPATRPTMSLHALTSGGRTRWYRVHEPDDYDPRQPVPVLLAFHGGGGNARQFADQTDLWVTADRHDFLLVFPEGTGALGVPPFFALETWNAGDCCGWAAEHGVDDVQFARDLVSDLAAQWNVATDHVWATGHSNGGMMAYRLGIEAPDLVAAIAPNAAARGIAGSPAAPVPVLVMHGGLDDNVPWRGGVGSGISGTDFRSQRDSIAPFARVNGATAPVLAEVRGRARRFEAAGTTGADLRYWWLPDHGHSWPGHGAGIPGEQTSFDVDANEEIWAFCSRY